MLIKSTQPMKESKLPDGRIDFLDFMRIFAFISVLVGHKYLPQLSALASDPSNHITIRYIAQGLIPLCAGGAAGVIVFFLISGYIITHVLQKESAIEFVIKRIFRIYPLYVFAVFAEAYVGFIVQGLELPPLSVWIPRLLLVGDFFDTPYALEGVEWTLRIEIVFYLFMAILKSAGLFKRPEALPALFVLCTGVLHLVKPFPEFAGWSNGYLSLYGPFLFVGSLIYLAEHRKANRKYCIVGAIFIFMAFLVLLAKIQPNWKESNYAAFALLLFLAAWGIRGQLTGGPLIRLLSDLTYSVYLFHNWLWFYLMALATKIGFSSTPYSLPVLLSLLIFCYVINRTVEKHGIKLGRYVVTAFLRGERGRT